MRYESTKVGILFTVHFCTENATFWPVLTDFGYFVANLRSFRVQGGGVPKLKNIRHAKVDRLGRKIDHIFYNTSFDNLRAFLKLGLCATRL